MFSWLGGLFGGKSNLSKTIDGISAGIDKAFLTDEERLDYQKGVRDWFVKYLEATQPQNISRRFIAIIVVALWGALILTAVISYAIAPDFSEFVFKTLQENVDKPFMIVMGFYFANAMLRTWTEKRK